MLYQRAKWFAAPTYTSLEERKRKKEDKYFLNTSLHTLLECNDGYSRSGACNLGTNDVNINARVLGRSLPAQQWCVSSFSNDDRSWRLTSNWRGKCCLGTKSVPPVLPTFQTAYDECCDVHHVRQRPPGLHHVRTIMDDSGVPNRRTVEIS